jgi:plastocyanin
VLAIAAGLLLAAGAGYALIGSNSDETATGTGETVHLNIPSNASELIEQGEDVPQIPDRITGSVGDTLVIRNRDRSTQTVAGYPVSPGQTLKIPLNRAGSYETSCSAHPEDRIKMVISQ